MLSLAPVQNFVNWNSYQACLSVCEILLGIESLDQTVEMCKLNRALIMCIHFKDILSWQDLYKYNHGM